VLGGSDWPVLELAASYRDWWSDTQAQFESLSAAECASVLGDTARRVYRL